MQSALNLKTKFRESFRPFAPRFSQSSAAEFFDWPGRPVVPLHDVRDRRPRSLSGLQSRRPQPPSAGAAARSGSSASAVTHVDRLRPPSDGRRRPSRSIRQTGGTLRTADGDAVLVINTSFNVRGEPIVCTAEDAYRCFYGHEYRPPRSGPFPHCGSDQPRSLPRMSSGFARRFRPTDALPVLRHDFSESRRG